MSVERFLVFCFTVIRIIECITLQSGTLQISYCAQCDTYYVQQFIIQIRKYSIFSKILVKLFSN